MQERGHDVVVLLGGNGPVTDQLDGRQVRHTTIPTLQKAIHPTRDATAVLATARALREFRPDLISTHTAKAGFVGRAAARLLGIPAVFTPHGWAIGDRLGRTKGQLFALAERLAAPWTAAFINVCEAERRLALSRGIGDPGRHHVIYNGVHPLGPAARATPGDPASTVRIVSVARFEPPKDHDTLLAALGGLEGGNWHLDLIGDGPLESEYRDRVDHGRVTIHGYLPDPSPLLARAHMFVLSSRSEAFPRSILEAMRAGLPVIASDVGGVSEAVTGANGRVVPPGNPVALREAIRELLQFPSQRQLLGDAGHLIYSQRFRFEHTLLATELLYRTLT
jgi:glycosyltransferase involved in cell wall biosynthesis